MIIVAVKVQDAAYNNWRSIVGMYSFLVKKHLSVRIDGTNVHILDDETTVGLGRRRYSTTLAASFKIDEKAEYEICSN